MLDRVNNSFLYRGASYYTVAIIHNGTKKYVDTNPYFQTYFSPYKFEYYNNKKVIGLYDANKEKFYIVNKV